MRRARGGRSEAKGPGPPLRAILVDRAAPSRRLTPVRCTPYSPRGLRASARPFVFRRGAAPLLAAAALLVSPLPARAQVFAVGAGASIVSDQGTLVYVNSFDHWGGSLFGEISLEGESARHDAVLQLRWSHFGLPGSAADAPSVQVDAGLISVYYRYRETWWEAGLFGGLGLYHLAPRDPGEGQVATDPTETVVGFHGGLVSIFQLSKTLDLRLELAGYVPRSEVDHKIIQISALFGYRF